MIFSTTVFLFLFFPLTVAGYYLLDRKFRNVFLLIASLGFYAWGEPRFVFVMLAAVLANYLLCLGIDAFKTKPILRKLCLILVVGGNLSLLGVYKYLNFITENLNHFGAHLTVPGIALPIGISFFIFQAISYDVDVYRGTVRVQKNPLNLALFISLFPQMVAGPIVRYQTVATELTSRRENWNDFTEGVRRFIIGFCKKVLIANNMALVADAAFGAESPSVAFAWLGALAYTFQIFFDFSGYSEMAIGLGRMFGFHFLENFNYPYVSKTVSEFWRRWHISLGQWFRDYVYFPLGGSRVKTKGRLIFNLFVVWLLTGVWHGAAWNFILWGLLYFVLIAFEKLTGFPGKRKGAQIAYRVFTLLAVVFGWVLFRAVDLPHAGAYLAAMFGSGTELIGASFLGFVRDYIWIFLFALVGSAPLLPWLRRKIEPKAAPLVAYGSLVFWAVAFVWAVSYIIMGGHNPFIYFNF